MSFVKVSVVHDGVSKLVVLEGGITKLDCNDAAVAADIDTTDTTRSFAFEINGEDAEDLDEIKEGDVITVYELSPEDVAFNLLVDDIDDMETNLAAAWPELDESGKKETVLYLMEVAKRLAELKPEDETSELVPVGDESCQTHRP